MSITTPAPSHPDLDPVEGRAAGVAGPARARPGALAVGPVGRIDGRPDPTGRRIAWLASAAMAAMVVAVDPGGLRPFTTARWPVVAGLVLLAGAFAWRARPRLPRPLAIVSLAFFGWLLLATLLAEDRWHAWVGHPVRHLGLAGWLVSATAFVVGSAIRSDDARRVLGRGAIAAAGLLAAGAALPAVGIDIAGAADAYGSRAGGLFGQPAYLGAAGVLFVPVALATARNDVRAWRWAGWIAAGGATTAVVASQTRGAWLGLLVAGVVGWSAVRPRGRRAWAVVAAGSVVLVAVAVLTPVGGRALDSFDLDDGTTRGRIDEWRTAAAVVGEHPFVGAGPEGYRVVVPTHLDDDYTRHHGREVGVDRAHDVVLDVAAIGGLPAAALYVGLVAMVLVAVLRARRLADPVVVGLAAAVAGYVTQQVVLFPVAEIDPIAWLFAGAVVAAVATARRSPGDGSVGTRTTVEQHHDRDRSRRGVRRAVGLVVVLLVGALGAATIAALVADRELATAAADLARGDQVGAARAADAATQRRPDDIDTWFVAAGVHARGESILDVDTAIDRIEAGLERSPRDPVLLDRREQLLVERALRSQLAADLDLAVTASQERIADDPSNPAHHRRLGLVLLARGDGPAAVAPLERALDLDADDRVALDALERARAADR